jgi:hypothetical protein
VGYDLGNRAPERIVRLMRMRKREKRDLLDWFGVVKCVLYVGPSPSFSYLWAMLM